MRSTCDILVYLDVAKALKNGLPLFLSSNNVVLSPGSENGIVPMEYFKYVLNVKDLKPFDPDFPLEKPQ